MSQPLSPDEYRELLRSALPVSGDADTLPPNLRTLFTPDGHRLALEPEVTVVRGARGVGKTVWFKVLQDSLLRRVVSEVYQLSRLTQVQPHPGFGSELAPDRYPGPAVLENLLGRTTDPTQIWTSVLVTALDVDEVRPLTSWRERLDWVQHNPEALEHALAKADRAAAEAGHTRLVLFDALDRLHVRRSVSDELVGGVLRLALDLRTRTRHLRAKVFIRHDMFDSGRLHFPDSSKLLSNAADLTWTEPNLYGLLFHHLGNADSALAKRFRNSHPRWREETRGNAAPSRYAPPRELIGDRRTQQGLFVEIAGHYMGTDHRKGHTYTWLPNHLMDGISQVSPRSFLHALAKAVEVTQTHYAGHRYALHYEGIRRGVQEASRIRVQEVAEDLPWVKLAVGALEGTQVPADLEMIVDRWTQRSLSAQLAGEAARIDLERDAASVRTGPKDPNSYRDLVDELVALGVMTRRANGRIDLPDVYRIAFNVGRRGGVPRLKVP